MFALLFDRKSLTMTLLALGGMGVLLFTSGFVLGSYLNGGLEHLGVVAQESAFTARPAGTLRTTTPAASRRSGRRTAAPAAEAPEILEAAPEPATGSLDAAGDETSAPPADWVPLEEGGSWPGEEPAVEPVPQEISTVETARTLVAETDPEDVTGAPQVASHQMEAPRRAQGFYYVQLGTFSREELALEKQAEVESRIAENDGVAPFLTPVTSRDGRTAYAVRVGPFPTRGAAREAAASYGRASIVWSSSGRAL